MVGNNFKPLSCILNIFLIKTNKKPDRHIFYKTTDEEKCGMYFANCKDYRDKINHGCLLIFVILIYGLINFFISRMDYFALNKHGRDGEGRDV